MGRTRRSLQCQINIVPFLDVMLVLLVIFMVAALLINPAVIVLPTAGDKPKASRPTHGDPDARRWGLRGHAIPLSRLGIPFSTFDSMVALVSKQHLRFPDAHLHIPADKDLPNEKVAAVQGALHEAGIANFGLVATVGQ